MSNILTSCQVLYWLYQFVLNDLYLLKTWVLTLGNAGCIFNTTIKDIMKPHFYIYSMQINNNVHYTVYLLRNVETTVAVVKNGGYRLDR